MMTGGATILGGPTGSSAAGWWQPGAIASWAYEIGAGNPPIPVKVGGVSDQVQVVDIDAGNTGGLGTGGVPVSDSGTAVDNAAIHAYGGHSVCYVDVGTAENWRSDYKEFASTDIGGPLSGWPGEFFINVNNWSTVVPAGYETIQQIMTNRFQLCKNEGFDAVEADNVDAYTDGSLGGFTISMAQEETYINNLIAIAHNDGLAYFLKNEINGDSLITDMAPKVDGEIDEQCWEYKECSSLDIFVQEGKPVLNVEYNGASESSICPSANAFPMSTIMTNVDVTGTINWGCWQYGTGPVITTTTTTTNPPPTSTSTSSTTTPPGSTSSSTTTTSVPPVTSTVPPPTTTQPPGSSTTAPPVSTSTTTSLPPTLTTTSIPPVSSTTVPPVSTTIPHHPTTTTTTPRHHKRHYRYWTDPQKEREVQCNLGLGQLDMMQVRKTPV